MQLLFGSSFRLWAEDSPRKHFDVLSINNCSVLAPPASKQVTKATPALAQLLLAVTALSNTAP